MRLFHYKVKPTFKLIALIYFIFTSSFHYSSLQAATGGLSPTLFLEEGASPTNMALGYAGSGTELGQMWYNPAFLFDSIKGRVAGISYIGDPGGFLNNYAFLSYGFPTKIGKFLLGFSYLGNTELERYNLFGEFEEFYSTAEMLFGVSHIWQISNQIYFSETIKLFYLNYYYTESAAIALDVAMLYKPLPFLQLSVGIDNLIASRFSFLNGEEALPVLLKIGPQFVFLKGKARLYYLMDINLPVYEEVYEYVGHKIGMEFDVYKKYFRFRAGYDGNFFTTGFGSEFSTFSMNFAYIPRGYENLLSMSFTYQIDKGRSFRVTGKDGKGVSDDEIIDFYMVSDFKVTRYVHDFILFY